LTTFVERSQQDIYLHCNEIKITEILVGIVLGMRSRHSIAIGHHDLKSSNILLDSDLNIWISDSWHCISSDKSPISSFSNPGISKRSPPWDYHHVTAGCDDQIVISASHIFSSRLILYELIVGRRAFPQNERPTMVAQRVTVEKSWPSIPDFVPLEVTFLICDCWSNDSLNRPSVRDIFAQLKEMQFQVTQKVNSMKVNAFVEAIEKHECPPSTPTAECCSAFCLN
jgi:serine/threonine protein kinase